MRSITLNTDSSTPKKALVCSLLNPSRAEMPEFTLGEVCSANLLLIKPSAPAANGYDPTSGSSNYAVSVGLGTPGQSPPVGAFTSWTPSPTLNPTGWTGLIYFNTTSLINQFAISGGGYLPFIYSTLEISYVGTDGNPVVLGSPQIKIYNRVLVSGSSTNPAVELTQIYSIGNGVSSATITGLALAAAPRMIFVSVEKPANGFNLFATVVSGSITTDGFSFDLSGITDQTGYQLVYKMIF